MADKTHYEAVLEDLERQRAGLDQAIAVIRQLLGRGPTNGAHGIGDPIPPIERPVAGATDIPRNAFTGTSLPDAIKGYLRMVNKRQTPKQIHDGIVRGGFHTRAKKLYANVYTTLLRLEQGSSKDIVKIENEWGLGEWYPSMRKVGGKMERGSDTESPADEASEAENADTDENAS
jgi:hypothetical protein